MTIDTSILEQYGFQLEEMREIAELNTVAVLMKHGQSGARVLSLHNDDENKVFGVNFRTPPGDSTGIAHIMEHSVLCGSEKFPVKEPFVELMKGSLNTFLNAFTYPDKTCYPVASQNLEDFYNLVEVYLDAAFFPRINPEVLKQEGWHYELGEEDGKEVLTYKGVVYNEMKGSYSSPMTLMYQHSKEHLYPDNAYKHSSGGDPDAIPDLTFKQFHQFHQEFYHPSNAFVYFYGDNDLKGRLESITPYLNRFNAIEVNSAIALQKPLEAPREYVYHYDAGEGASENKTMVTWNWLLPEGSKIEDVMALSVLDYILLGSSAAPLEKALIDSGLGESVIGGGLATELRQMNYSVGLKNIRSSDIQKVEELIVSTLKKLIDGGIERDAIDAALNTVEFSLRENNTGRYPRGLSLMLRVLTRWLHDESPFKMLAYEEPLEAVKNKAKEPGYFEKYIKETLLDNPHRVRVVLEPRAGFAEDKIAAERDKLEKIRQTLSSEEKETIRKEAAQLQELQQKEDSQEALASIPRLTLDQLERKPKDIPTEEFATAGATTLYHDLFTNGVNYFDLVFGLESLTAEQIPYLPIFCRSLFQMGTKEKDFVTLVQTIDKSTGGMSASPWIIAKQDDSRAGAYVLVRGKVLKGNSDSFFNILGEVLQDINFDQQERFLQLVRQRKAGLESRVISSGHSYAMMRLSAMHSQAGWINEQTDGVHQLHFMRALEKRVEENWSEVLKELQSMQEAIFNSSRFVANLTLSKDCKEEAITCLEGFIKSLPKRDSSPVEWPLTLEKQDSGVVIPSLVNFVAKGGSLYDHGYEYNGSVKVITKYLRSAYLWDKVRVQGGAYGAFCSFSKPTGLFALCSYRDPNFDDTLAVYDGIVNFLRDQEIPEEELHKNIIGTIGDLDSYQLPDSKGFTALSRYLRGISKEQVAEERAQVFQTTVDHFRKFGEVVGESLSKDGRVCVFGAETSFESSKTGIKPEKLFT